MSHKVGECWWLKDTISEQVEKAYIRQILPVGKAIVNVHGPRDDYRLVPLDRLLARCTLRWWQ